MVSPDATECVSCGEQFSTSDTVEPSVGEPGTIEELTVEETEDIQVSTPETEDDMDYECPSCGAVVDENSEECILCGAQFGLDESLQSETAIPEEPDHYECPSCGGVVEADAEECILCETQFGPDVQPQPHFEDELLEEFPLEEEEELEITEEDVPYVCNGCGAELDPDDDVCAECGELIEDIASEGCPICGSAEYNTESGDLVSCGNCGNVYVKEYDAGIPEKTWKWKFWLGLFFIFVGDLGFALSSYIHNVYRWSPLGDLYLGYGWMDTMVGAVGVVIFIMGLVLFAWSFKKEREVQCPSCKLYIKELELEPVPEVDEMEDESIDGVIEQIEDVAECPNCSASTSIFDEQCPDCGMMFETHEVDEIVEEEIDEGEVQLELSDEVAEEGEMPLELDEELMLLESLEYEEVTDTKIEAPGPADATSELESTRLLDELELELETDELSVESSGDVKETECMECGMIVDAESVECPVCGASLSKEGDS